MPRGGKRPGAGAPKGNLNALKHGRRSRQFAQMGAILAESPAARKALLRYADRQDLKDRRADEIAAHLLDQIVARGLVIGRDRLLLLPELTRVEKEMRKPRRRRLVEPAPLASDDPAEPGIERRTIRKTARNAQKPNETPPLP